MITKMRDFSKILQDVHADKWVALSPTYDSVVAYSSDLLELKEIVAGRDVVYMKAPSLNTIYAFSVTIFS